MPHEKLHYVIVDALQGLVFVNEYAIITTLGRGSFGEVKLALNTIDMEVYALKLIAKTRRRAGSRSKTANTAEASVMGEINVMKELSHPNLVRLVEVIGELLPVQLLDPPSSTRPRLHWS